MEITRYRNYIMEQINNIEAGLQQTDKQMVIRDFSDEELTAFVEASLTEKERTAVQMRFASGKSPSYRAIAAEMGVTPERVRQLITSSVNRFLHPAYGFRMC